MWFMPHPGFSVRSLSPGPCFCSDIALLCLQSPTNANGVIELGREKFFPMSIPAMLLPGEGSEVSKGELGVSRMTTI